jgi:hypothetical protein
MKKAGSIDARFCFGRFGAMRNAIALGVTLQPTKMILTKLPASKRGIKKVDKSIELDSM